MILKIQSSASGGNGLVPKGAADAPSPALPQECAGSHCFPLEVRQDTGTLPVLLSLRHPLRCCPGIHPTASLSIWFSSPPYLLGVGMGSLAQGPAQELKTWSWRSFPASMIPWFWLQAGFSVLPRVQVLLHKCCGNLAATLASILQNVLWQVVRKGEKNVK